MSKITVFIMLLLCANALQAQDSLAPLYGNEVLQMESQNKMATEDASNYSYRFKLDTNHLPIVDDFSKNFFKSYTYDTLSTANDTQVWYHYLFNGLYQDEFLAMNDTSYWYTVHPDSTIDSTAFPATIVITYSQTVYQMPIDTDTVWVRPDSLIRGGTVTYGHSADRTFTNYLDSAIIVPDVGYSIWRNNNVLHNYTYGDDPVTLGVATFDGLDSTGVPYDPTMSPNAYQIADVLESKPIYLKTRPDGGTYNAFQDTGIYLSFYYQPQGLGDAPEPGDSLILQFYAPVSKTWQTQWKAEGSLVQPFRNVMVHINKSIYFRDGFKFRFMNYASVNGNFDHWNIDYVRLFEPRTANDSIIDDVAILDKGTSLLKDFAQMPWEHYKQSSTNLMKDKQGVRYRNLFDASTFVISSFNVYEDGLPVFDGSLEPTPIVPAFGIVDKESTVQGSFPTTNPDSTHSFHVHYWVQPGSDTVTVNDTSYFHQQFGTQYAYDDGSAESAYFVTTAGAQIAVEYDIAITDTLKAVNIYFPRSYVSIIDRPFRVMVWESLEPEVILYEGYLENPIYAGDRDLVQGYKLEEPIEVSGKIYVGIKQYDETVYIGMDRNNNSQFKNFFKVQNQWQNASYEGSLFIRPEFGAATNPWEVSVQEISENTTFRMYPNPTSSQVTLEMQGMTNFVTVRSLVGTTVRSFEAGQNVTFQMGGMAKGLYFVEVTNLETNTSSVEKLLIQ